MRNSGPYHEVTVKRADDWGEASAVRTVCGYLGRFQSAYERPRGARTQGRWAVRHGPQPRRSVAVQTSRGNHA